MKWNSSEPPKDGRKIIRWHKVWKCSVSVYYAPQNEQDDNKCFWTTSTKSQTWPEEAFLPEWREELEAPSKKQEKCQDEKKYSK